MLHYRSTRKGSSNAYRLIVLLVIMNASIEMTFPQTFSEFIASVRAVNDSLTRFNLIQGYFSTNTIPLIEGESVHFLYRGKGKVVAVPGEMNEWNPSDAMMERILGTNIWFRTYTIPVNGRVEYKIWVDSIWTLDPFNKRKARGGYGENSDLWMPEYVPPVSIDFNPNIPHGRIDTIWCTSKILGRTHPVFVYLPPNISDGRRLPTMYVTDGGEYLSFAKMHNVLNNLLAEGQIQPVLGVFIDPRAGLHDPSSNQRMLDYAANEKFLDFLEKELTPFLQTKYSVALLPSQRLIIGASMGGLIATYAVLQRPEFVTNCAAQSPAYFQADSAVIKLAKRLKKSKANIYIDTGTIHDAQVEAKLVRRILKDRGVKVKYIEVPEGHNWSNWRARLPLILEHFFPTQ